MGMVKYILKNVKINEYCKTNKKGEGDLNCGCAFYTLYVSLGH